MPCGQRSTFYRFFFVPQTISNGNGNGENLGTSISRYGTHKKRKGDKKLMNNDKPTKPRFVDVVDDDDVDVEVIDEPIDQAATQIDIQRNTRIPIDKKNGIKKDFFVWLADVSFRGIPDDSPMSTMIFLKFFLFYFFFGDLLGMLSSSSSSLRGVYRLTECEGSLECLL